MEGWYGRIFRGCGYFDPDKPIRDFTKKELEDLLYKDATKIKVEGINLTYAGLIPTIQKSFLSKDVEAMQPHIRAFVERAVVFSACPECAGTRLSKEARSSKVRGINIADACAMQISDLAEWVRGLDEPSVAPLLAALGHSLDSFVEIGLGYLSLDRPSGTLSGGEAQRTKMIRHLGSSLTDVTYCCACATRATRCSWLSTSPKSSRLRTTSSTSARAPAAAGGRWCSRAPSTACARAAL
jgi:excinuclease UvrABC ATPase subunit